MAQTTRDERPSCPCKRLPLSLSSFTAAAYGDLHRLHLKRDKINKADAGGSTPLHLAAQHGHVMATARLLQLGARVDGGYMREASSPSTSFSFTPLHRASFSGAVATMKLLIDSGADIMARDLSFGDERTPLHKAAAGGRHLAVKLLLESLSNQKQYQEAVRAKDAYGLTPLQVAQNLTSQQQEERVSVQRWDETAGGEANWEMCVEELERAQKGISNKATMRVPSHLQSSWRTFCMDCTDSSGQCQTAAWETALRSALMSNQCLTVPSTVPTESQLDIANKDEHEAATEKSGGNLLSHRGFLYNSSSCSTATNETTLGQCCRTCGKRSFAFVRDGNGQLVCKACSVPTSSY